MRDLDIVLLTEAKYISVKNVDQYVQNVLDEQALIQNALEAKGLKVAKVDWADSNFDWSSARAILFREIWNYFYRFSEFSPWFEEVSTKTQMINSADQIRWNLDKHYLNDLENKGINVCTTRFIEVGEERSLGELINEEALDELVLKPAVSGGGRHTYRINKSNIGEHEAIFKELIAGEAMMIQPFQVNVISKGEVAYMVFGGEYSHAILKQAKEGDFRVQDDFGGSVQGYNPSDEEIAFAEQVVASVAPLPVYARVDVIWDNDNKLAVTELELIEPELWMRFKPEAAELFADAVINTLKHHNE